MLEIWRIASWKYGHQRQTTIAPPSSAGLITTSFLSYDLLMAFRSSLEVLLCIEVTWLLRMSLISIRQLDMTHQVMDVDLPEGSTMTSWILDVQTDNNESQIRLQYEE